MWRIPVYGDQLKCEKEYFVQIRYFVNVQNSVDVRAKLMKGELEASCVDATNILSPEHLLMATNKALHSLSSGAMTTRSVYSEVLYNLSPSLKITDSLKKFGIQDGSKELMSIQIQENSNFLDLNGVIQGEERPVDSLVNDEDHITKLYAVTPDELQVGSLLEAICLRIATKEIS